MKVTDSELIGRIEELEGSSYGINDAALSRSRAEAFEYYNGDPFGNEVEGRSSVVSRDVLDVVEAALPQLLKVFVSGDEIVRFEPRGPEDEKPAEQETAAVNYYTLEKNDGFAVFYTWFKDALLSKNGYVKVWWEEEDDTETETYQGLTDDQLTMLVEDNNVSVIEHTSYPDEIDAQQRQEAIQQNPQAAQQIQSMPPKMCHDVKIEVTETKGCVRIDNVAPEDILIGVDTRTVSLQDATFVQHRALMDRSEIEEQGWKVPDSALTENENTGWEESNSRDLYNERQESEAFDQYLVKDTYIKVNGDMIRAVIIGNEVVHREEAEIVPFACITPHIMPHRHIGLSYTDLTKDVQLIKSTLLRGQLDNMYLSNNGRYAISDRVNLEDMLTSRPGGVVRVSGEPGAAIFPLQHAPFPPTSFQLVEYLDSAKEKRTGITAYNQGLDANSLNKTATGVNQIMQATQQRVELVARTFANTGVKELFMLVHRLVRKYNTRPEIIRLRDDWVTVDPREWKERNDMSISVGLGTGNKDQQLMHLNNLIALQFQALQAGLPMVTPENVYNTARQLVINSGFKQPDQFVTDPKNVPPKPPTPDPKIQLKQMDLQADAQKFQAQTVVDKNVTDKQAQLDIMKFQAQATIDQQKADRVWEQEQLRSQNDVTIEKEKIAAQMELERYKAELKAQTDLQIAQLQMEANDRQLHAQMLIESQKADNEQKRHEEQLAAMTRSKTATMPNGKKIKVD
jgi:hypothetical protein